MASPQAPFFLFSAGGGGFFAGWRPTLRPLLRPLAQVVATTCDCRPLARWTQLATHSTRPSQGSSRLLHCSCKQERPSNSTISSIKASEDGQRRSGQPTARLKAAVARLESGLLPGEFRPAVPVPAGSLAASARANAQHHAEAAPLPAGRPARAAGSSGSSGSSGGGGATRAAISSHRDRSQHAARSIRID